MVFQITHWLINTDGIWCVLNFVINYIEHIQITRKSIDSYNSLRVTIPRRREVIKRHTSNLKYYVQSTAHSMIYVQVLCSLLNLFYDFEIKIRRRIGIFSDFTLSTFQGEILVTQTVFVINHLHSLTQRDWYRNTNTVETPRVCATRNISVCSIILVR